MERRITCYVPFKVNNLYADNVKRLVKDAGYECVSIKQCLLNPKLMIDCKIFNFNWFETVKADNELKERFIYFAKVFLILFLKSIKKKIVYTIHNKQPHNIGSKNIYSKKMMKFLMRNADAIVSLCPETYDIVNEMSPEDKRKIHDILHPSYIYNYVNVKRENYKEKYGLEKKDMVLLFLGFVTPYKNVEVLIDSVKAINDNRLKLIIAGNASNAEYKKKLIDRIGENSNIITEFRYIPDEEIPTFYETADIVILPYKKESAMNSGAAYLSFSLGRTVICPKIGTIKGLKDKSFVYYYDYETDEEHKMKLSRLIYQVYDEYKMDTEALRSKGNSAYKYMLEIHDDRIISNMYKQLYDSLFG